MDKFQGMNRFLAEKLRAPTMTAHDAPDGGDQQLADAAAAVAEEAGDFPYTPPFPVPLMTPAKRGAGMRGAASEVWLVNPPATLPAVGVLVAGGNAEKGSQFPINSIRVDNLTSQWMYWPEIGAFVPPFWYGRVFRFTGALIQRVKFETPTGIIALAAATTDVARVMFSEEYWDEQSGASMAGNMPATTTGSPNIGVTIFDDASGLPAEVQTSADGLAQQAGLVVDAFLFGRNAGGTMDELRTWPVSLAALAVQPLAVGVGLMNSAGNIQPAANQAAIGDGTAAGNALATSRFSWNGVTEDRDRQPNIYKQVTAAINAGSTAVIWTPAAGKKPRIMGWVMSAASALTGDASATFFDTATTGAFMGETGFMSGTEPPYAHSFGPSGPIVALASGTILAFSSVAVTLRGMLYGTEE